MSYRPGSRGWRDVQLDGEQGRPGMPDGGDNEPVGPPVWEHWVALASEHRRATALIAIAVLALLIVLTRRSPAHRAAPSPHTTTHAHPAAQTVTRTAWTDEEARPFTTGLWGEVSVATVQPRTGPAALWPALSASASLPRGRRRVVLGLVGNSQESTRWAAVRLPGGEVGWVPAGALVLSGTLHAPPSGQPDSYVVTGDQPLTAWRRPDLPNRPDSAPSPVAIATIGPGSVLPLRGVLPRYFDGRRGTSWVRVHLPDGSFGWLHQENANLRRDVRYLLPPAHAAESPWAAPLQGAHTMLGAYGEALGTPQWALRGATLVRGQAGDQVTAAADGVVIFTGYSVRWARYEVVVRHNGTWDGWQTSYLGLDVAAPHGLRVAEGQAVHRGQVLGYVAPGANQQPTSLLFVVQTPDGTPIESQSVLQWP